VSLDLFPVRTFGRVLHLASFHGSSLKVFKMRRVQRLLESGRTAEAKKIVGELIRTSKLAREEGTDELQLKIASGELIAQLGGVDVAVNDYLVDAAQTLIDYGQVARAREVLESVLEARPTHEAARRQLSRAMAQLEKE
jgi:hypothetical protein